jgi:hypothetical protein
MFMLLGINGFKGNNPDALYPTLAVAVLGIIGRQPAFSQKPREPKEQLRLSILLLLL